MPDLWTRFVNHCLYPFVISTDLVGSEWIVRPVYTKNLANALGTHSVLSVIAGRRGSLVWKMLVGEHVVWEKSNTLALTLHALLLLTCGSYDVLKRRDKTAFGWSLSRLFEVSRSPSQEEEISEQTDSYYTRLGLGHTKLLIRSKANGVTALFSCHEFTGHAL